MLQCINGLEFYQGVPSDLQLDGRPTLLILDDLMLDMQNDKALPKYFTKMRHENLSVIFLIQNLYFKSAYATTITRNAQYLVLFPNVRDTSIIATLGRQMYPQHKHFIFDAFKDATSTPYGYLFLDLKTETPDKLRVRSHIFPDNSIIIYRPKS